MSQVGHCVAASPATVINRSLGLKHKAVWAFLQHAQSPEKRTSHSYLKRRPKRCLSDLILFCLSACLPSHPVPEPYFHKAQPRGTVFPATQQKPGSQANSVPAHACHLTEGRSYSGVSFMQASSWMCDQHHHVRTYIQKKGSCVCHHEHNHPIVLKALMNLSVRFGYLEGHLEVSPHT